MDNKSKAVVIIIAPVFPKSVQRRDLCRRLFSHFTSVSRLVVRHFVQACKVGSDVWNQARRDVWNQASRDGVLGVKVETLTV